MEEKLERLFKESLKELEQIGISFENLGKIDISISKRNNKRYGCCKQEEPDKKTNKYRPHKRKKLKKEKRKLMYQDNDN